MHHDTQPAPEETVRAFLAALSVLVVAAPALGASTVTCHCFRDRSFDPARPAAADTYVLATSRNSLLAEAYGVSKGTVVRALMTGTPPEDLWVAHEVARLTGLAVREVLDAKSRERSWVAALEALAVDGGRLDPELARRIRTGRAPASVVVDRVLRERLKVPAERIRALREAGAGDAQTVAACVLGRLTGEEPVDLFWKVRSGDTTWGALFHAAGVAPSDIDETIARLMG